MGIPSHLAQIILREHQYRPIEGAMLSIARQTVYNLGIDRDSRPKSSPVAVSWRHIWIRRIASTPIFDQHCDFSEARVHRSLQKRKKSDYRTIYSFTILG
jgi:hypothetical protein